TATHLFNAMAPLHHREPGPVVALLDDDRVTVELVTDGLHVHPALWEHAVRLSCARPARVGARGGGCGAAPGGRPRPTRWPPGACPTAPTGSADSTLRS